MAELARTSCAVTSRLLCHNLQRSTGTTVSIRFKLSWTPGPHIISLIRRELQIPCKKFPMPLHIQALDGRPIGSSQVEYQTKPILLKVGVNPSETLSFLLIAAPESSLMLGYPWLGQHNLLFFWSTGHLLDWGKDCQTKCLRPHQEPHRVLLHPLKTNTFPLSFLNTSTSWRHSVRGKPTLAGEC
jgi:hypothetical protein